MKPTNVIIQESDSPFIQENRILEFQEFEELFILANNSRKPDDPPQYVNLSLNFDDNQVELVLWLKLGEGGDVGLHDHIVTMTKDVAEQAKTDINAQATIELFEQIEWVIH